MVDVVPLPGEVGADVRLVLVIAADDLDLHAVGRGIEIFDRQFGGGHRARPADIGIETRHVGQDADFDDDIVLRLCEPAAVHIRAATASANLLSELHDNLP